MASLEKRRHKNAAIKRALAIFKTKKLVSPTIGCKSGLPSVALPLLTRNMVNIVSRTISKTSKIRRKTIFLRFACVAT